MMSYSEASEHSEGEEEAGHVVMSGALSSGGLLFRADLELCKAPALPCWTQHAETRFPSERPLGGALLGILRQLPWTPSLASLGRIDPVAEVSRPRDDIEREVARICMAEAQVQLKQATSGGLLSGFEIWKEDD